MNYLYITNMTYKLLIAWLFFLLYNLHLTAQTPSQVFREAQAAVERKDFNTALAHYGTLLQDDSTRMDLYLNLAETALNATIYKVSEFYFEKHAQLNPKNLNNAYYYKLGLAKKGLGKYDEAQILLDKVDSEEWLEAARIESKYCYLAKAAVKDSDTFQIKNMGIHLNTIFPDFGGVTYENNFYYTSAQATDSTDDAKLTMRIFSTDLTNGDQKGVPTNFNPTDSKTDAANFAPSSDGKRIYYTLRMRDGLQALYFREKDAAGNWEKPVRLPDNINLANCITTQPNIVKKGDKEILYFSSNRPQGKGGMDIWLSEVGATGFSTPVNVPDVNTSSDEITPFCDLQTGNLFFSSNGHRGLGGFDIFKYGQDSTGALSVQWMGYPLNGSYDEMYYTFNGKGDFYFTSNRPGGACARLDGNCMSNDIYTYRIENKPILKIPLPEVKPQKDSTLVTTPILSSEPMVSPPPQSPILVVAEPLLSPKEVSFDAPKAPELTPTVTMAPPQSPVLMVAEPLLSPKEVSFDAPKAPEVTQDLFKGLSVEFYFDNDMPDTRSNKTFTSIHYNETFKAYQSKRAEFVKKNNKNADKQSIEYFFDQELQTGYQQWLDYTAVLLKYLNEGHTIELVLGGYASPTASTDYNNRLSQRRISSVLNQLYTMQNGVFQPFMKNGGLRIRWEAYGSRTADALLPSDNPIYSVNASRQRKVKIFEVKRLEVPTTNEPYSGFELLKPFLASFR
jgi:tetratricopeptide (TPR) repeat protein/outer membrane protein OmpA-like peptidoglycan-associated protein